MPSYKGHLLGGFVVYIGLWKVLSLFQLSYNFSLHHQLVFLGATLVGSLFPDIDVASKMQKWFFIGMLIVLPCTLFYTLSIFIALSTLCFLLLLIPHRTLTHSLPFIILIPCIITATAAWYSPASMHGFLFSICTYFMAGALSHRLLDVGLMRFFSIK
jgi:hypothetical protein